MNQFTLQFTEGPVMDSSVGDTVHLMVQDLEFQLRQHPGSAVFT